MAILADPARARRGAQPARFGRWLVTGLVLAVGLGGGWVWWHSQGHASHQAGDPKATVRETERTGGGSSTPAARIDVVHPRAGGLARHTIQPGSIHAYESVDVYSKASGFLKAQSVDIGSVVKEGEILAEIDAPELQKDVEEASAAVELARTRAALSEARVASAEAERDAVAANVAQAEADIAQTVAKRSLSEKQFDRIKGLHARDAVEKQLVDEHEHDLESARAGERSARAAVLTAQAQLSASEARIQQARADVAESKAAIRLAETRLERARVVDAFTRITAPFDGVVTARHFHPGAFIRSAADGEPIPLLTVKRVDRMRVVVQVPDLDIALLDDGDPATVEIDALKGRSFTGTISRRARAETPTTRTMRVEIDLENPAGVLCEGMYGRATIVLRPPSKGLSVPSSCVLGHTANGQAKVYVVRETRVVPTAITIGEEDGSTTEVLAGLSADDAVILNPRSIPDEGVPVSANLIAAADVPR
jgi:HlyD family secretion protein